MFFRGRSFVACCKCSRRCWRSWKRVVAVRRQPAENDAYGALAPMCVARTRGVRVGLRRGHCAQSTQIGHGDPEVPCPAEFAVVRSITHSTRFPVPDTGACFNDCDTDVGSQVVAQNADGVCCHLCMFHRKHCKASAGSPCRMCLSAPSEARAPCGRIFLAGM